MRQVFVLLSLLLWAGTASAVEPDEVLSDPVLENRARLISQGLRCLQCRNESIDESNAGIARDLRLLVRDRLLEGDSDTEVMDYVVARYGICFATAQWIGYKFGAVVGGAGVVFGLTCGADCRAAAQQTQRLHRPVDRRRRKRN